MSRRLVFSSHGVSCWKKGENSKDGKGSVVSGKAVRDANPRHRSESKSVKAESGKLDEEVRESDGEAKNLTVNLMAEEPEQAILPGLMTPLLSGQHADEHVSVSAGSETEINFLNTPKKSIKNRPHNPDHERAGRQAHYDAFEC